MRQTNKNWVVYAHKNKINKKIYIGITGQKPERRWRNGQGYKTSTYFYNAIQKYGWDNFEHIILQFNLTQQEAEEKEKYYIQKYNTLNDTYGYNIKKGGKLNQGLSKQGRKKISQSSKKNWQNPEFKQKQSQKAKKQWENSEFKQKQSQKAKKQWQDISFKEKQYNQKTSKKVQCIETGDIFPSQSRAAAWCGLKCGASIARNANGKASYAGTLNGKQLHWRFI